MAIATSTAIIAGAVIAAAGATAGSAISAKAAKDAAKTQAEAAGEASTAEQEGIDKAIAFQREQFEQQREDFAPFREIGLDALETLEPLVGPDGELVRGFTLDDFEADPGYQFRLEEGTKALDRSASSRGQLYSGAQLRDLARFNQGLAKEEYGDAFNRFQIEQGNKFNRLGSLAGVGERATTTLGSFRSNTVRNVGNLQVAGGQSRASGYINAANANAAGRVGAGNAWAQGLSGVGSAANQGLKNYMLYSLARPPAGSQIQPILLN